MEKINQTLNSFGLIHKDDTFCPPLVISVTPIPLGKAMVNQHVNLIITNWATIDQRRLLLAITDLVPLEVLPFLYKNFES